MRSFQKQGIVSVGNPDRLDIKVNRRKEALRKLAQYLRNERDYSEKKIKKFIAQSFIEEID